MIDYLPLIAVLASIAGFGLVSTSLLLIGTGLWATTAVYAWGESLVN